MRSVLQVWDSTANLVFIYSGSAFASLSPYISDRCHLAVVYFPPKKLRHKGKSDFRVPACTGLCMLWILRVRTHTHKTLIEPEFNQVYLTKSSLKSILSQTGIIFNGRKGPMCVISAGYQNTVGPEVTLSWHGKGRGHFHPVTNIWRSTNRE